MPWKSLHQSLRNLQFSYTDMMNLPKGIQYLTSLQSLSLGSCWNVTNLPEWISCLSSLQSLSIEKCSAIKSLPDSMRNLASLQQLVIKSCTELEERCKEPNGEDWPKIQHIPHVDIREVMVADLVVMVIFFLPDHAGIVSFSIHSEIVRAPNLQINFSAFLV
ncbi:putative disease resistance protein RGA4 isoform X1 [Spinacia oleracea]|uniref:Disease resistance protein RGA4 isoform X1 n=1 Tax=Spinacia oleracea TaxID=3562 RepID=A0ABM3RTB0_SPIOL|nr:putative disease resistance protein RGA4 isoform X1 [Spinacia oleracea]